MIKITGLWKNKDKNGKLYLSGNLNGISKITIFQNDYKEKKTDPDYFLYIDKKETEEDKDKKSTYKKGGEYKKPANNDDLDF